MSSPTNTTLTVTGAVLGTPAYMAPEQLFGGPSDARSDQFSFCVALYEALSGARPFDARSIEELRAAMNRGPAPPPRGWIPDKVWLALARGLSFNPAARFPSMDALLAALADVHDAPANWHLKANAIGQIVMCMMHAMLTVFVVYALFDDSGGDAEAELDADPDNPMFLAIGYWLTALLATGWIPLGTIWTAINAWGLWARRAWAYPSSLIYAVLSMWTCLGTPYAIYALFSLTRANVRAQLKGQLPDNPR